MLAPPRPDSKPETPEIERADAFAALALQPSADANLVEIGYWCLVELAHGAELPEKQRRARIAVLNDARAALVVPDGTAGAVLRPPKVRVPRPRAPFWAMAVSLAVVVAVPAVTVALLRRSEIEDGTRLIAGIGAAILGLLLARAIWIRAQPVLPDVKLSAEEARGQLRVTADAPPPLRVLSHQYLRRRALQAEDYDAVRALDAAADLLRQAPAPPAEAVATAPLTPESLETARDETPAGDGRDQPEPEPELEAIAAVGSAAGTDRPPDDATPALAEPAGRSGQVARDRPLVALPEMGEATVEEPIAGAVGALAVAAVAASAIRDSGEPEDEVAPTAPIAGAAISDADEVAVVATTAGEAAPEAGDEPGPGLEPAPLLPAAAGDSADAGAALRLLRGTIQLGEVALENGRVYTIGSGRGADITLADHGAVEEAPVATEHARLTVRRGRVLFHHVGEQFESKVNGVATEWAVIEPGDEIEIGDYVLRCEAGAA